jgi:hypothetical protein
MDDVERDVERNVRGVLGRWREKASLIWFPLSDDDSPFFTPPT